MTVSKRILSILLSVLIVFSVSPLVFAANTGTTYYVDSINGDDSNSGTSESSAWKTIEKASSAEYVPGDSILFKAGGYFTGTFTAAGNGTSQNPITIGAYSDVDALGKPMLTSVDENAVIRINDVSYWTVSGLDISAPDGMGVYITCEQSKMNGITVENCSFHDVFKQRSPSQVKHLHASIGIYTVGSGLLSDVILRNIDIKDCGYGIWSDGNNIEYPWADEYYVSPEESYAQNLLYENITMNNVYYDGFAIGSVNNLTIRNCALINTAIYEDFYTAPTWMHHAKNVLIENCEIAGSTNTMDGMALDFDGWTTDSTYQYIYSHDNVRFIQNCVYDDDTQNRNCTVRYCLSVNDNKGLNNVSQMLGENAYVGMDNFKFYNNTIVDGGKYDFSCLLNSTIANNIFISNKKLGEIQIARNTSMSGVHKFDGTITNNCFVDYAIPPMAKNNAMSVPGFTGGDIYDINSYKLSASSPLIGGGIQAENDMGEHDFYGNELTDTHNIGCFDSAGMDDGAKITVWQKIGSAFSAIFYKLLGTYFYWQDKR